MILETARLILTTWEERDWRAFRPIATDPEVMRFITGGEPWPDERIHDFVLRQIALFQERQYCRWKLIEKETGELAGFCGVGFFQAGYEPEIGWWLARLFWGRGLASEAAKIAFHDAVDRAGLDRIVSVAQRPNVASIRIMEKLGLQFERNLEHPVFDLVQYAIERPRYCELYGNALRTPK